MKKLLSILFFLSFGCFNLAVSDDLYRSCGPKPGFFAGLISDAEKMRIKCIEGIYEENQAKIKKEVEELYEVNQQIKNELTQVAAKVNYNIIECSPGSNGVVRTPLQISRCKELVLAQQVVIGRIDELMGWNEKFKAQNADAALVEPPCPTPETLNKIKPVRYFHRKLYKTWERCVVLAN